MTTADDDPIVLDYLSKYLIHKEVLFWTELPKYSKRLDLIIRIEHELMRNAEQLGIKGLSYCPPGYDYDSIEMWCSIRPPVLLYHSNRYRTK